MMIRHSLFLVLALVMGSFSIGSPSYAQTMNYNYDGMGRLIQATYDDGTTIEYTYDKMGNRLQKIVYSSGSSCSPHKVTVSGSSGGFETIAEAVAGAGSGNTIKARNLIFSQLVSVNKIVTMIGGYNCDFSSNPNNTTLSGTLTVTTGGKLTISNFIIK
jgi:YD repeat-containing protein